MTEYKFDQSLQDTVIYLTKRFGYKSNSVTIRKAITLLYVIEQLADDDHIYVMEKLNSTDIVRINLVD